MSGGQPEKSLFSRDYDQFLELLRNTRLAAGYTQQKAAKLLNRPQSFVGKCESGERRVDIVELLAFCRIYGVDPAKFIQQLVATRR